MTILITGGAGFIGSSLADKLIEKGYQVVVLDNLQTGFEVNLPKSNNLTLIKGDVNRQSDVAGVFSGFKFDYIFHYAATVGVMRTLENPDMVLSDLEGFKHILNYAKNSGV